MTLWSPSFCSLKRRILLPPQGCSFCLDHFLNSQTFPGLTASHHSVLSSNITSSLQSFSATLCAWAPPPNLYQIILYPCLQNTHHHLNLLYWFMGCLLSLCFQNTSTMKGRDRILFTIVSTGLTHSRCSRITCWVTKWVSGGQGSPRWHLGGVNKW